MNAWWWLVVMIVAYGVFCIAAVIFNNRACRRAEINAAMKRHPAGNGKDLNNGR